MRSLLIGISGFLVAFVLGWSTAPVRELESEVESQTVQCRWTGFLDAGGAVCCPAYPYCASANQGGGGGSSDPYWFDGGGLNGLPAGTIAAQGGNVSIDPSGNAILNGCVVFPETGGTICGGSADGGLFYCGPGAFASIPGDGGAPVCLTPPLSIQQLVDGGYGQLEMTGLSFIVNAQSNSGLARFGQLYDGDPLHSAIAYLSNNCNYNTRDSNQLPDGGVGILLDDYTRPCWVPEWIGEPRNTDWEHKLLYYSPWLAPDGGTYQVLTVDGGSISMEDYPFYEFDGYNNLANFWGPMIIGSGGADITEPDWAGHLTVNGQTLSFGSLYEYSQSNPQPVGYVGPYYNDANDMVLAANMASQPDGGGLIRLNLANAGLAWLMFPTVGSHIAEFEVYPPDGGSTILLSVDTGTGALLSYGTGEFEGGLVTIDPDPANAQGILNMGSGAGLQMFAVNNNDGRISVNKPYNPTTGHTADNAGASSWVIDADGATETIRIYWSPPGSPPGEGVDTFDFFGVTGNMSINGTGSGADPVTGANFVTEESLAYQVGTPGGVTCPSGKFLSGVNTDAGGGQVCVASSGSRALTYGGFTLLTNVNTNDIGDAATWPAAGNVASLCYSIQVAGTVSGNFTVGAADDTGVALCASANIPCATAATAHSVCLYVSDGGLTGACSRAAGDVDHPRIISTSCSATNPELSALALGLY